jgi:hypothetical protein
MCTRERARRSRWSPAEVQILCRVLVETRPEPPVPCWPVGRRGFAARGSGRDVAVSRFGPRFRGFAGMASARDVVCPPVRTKVSGFGDDQLRGKPVGETPRRVTYVARTDYREEARKGRSRSFQMPIKASPSAGTGLRCRHGRATEGVACGRPRVRSRPWRRLSPRADGEDRERRRSQLVLDGRRGLSCTRERDRQD